MKEDKYINSPLPSPLCVLKPFFSPTTWHKGEIYHYFLNRKQTQQDSSPWSGDSASALSSSSVCTYLASNEAIYMQMQAWACGYQYQLSELLFHLIKRNLQMKATSLFINPKLSQYCFSIIPNKIANLQMIRYPLQSFVFLLPHCPPRPASE